MQTVQTSKKNQQQNVKVNRCFCLFSSIEMVSLCVMLVSVERLHCYACLFVLISCFSLSSIFSIFHFFHVCFWARFHESQREKAPECFRSLTIFVLWRVRCLRLATTIIIHCDALAQQQQTAAVSCSLHARIYIRMGLHYWPKTFRTSRNCVCMQTTTSYRYFTRIFVVLSVNW